MTRRRSLSPDKLREAFAQHRQGLGYETIARNIGSSASTVRDAVKLRTAYAAAAAAKSEISMGAV